MKKNCGYIVCLALITLHISSALAQEPDFLTISYDILSEGEDVGDITLRLFRTKNGYRIVGHDHIKASGWWGNIDIVTIMSEEFQHGSGLVSADSKTLEDDRLHWTRINASGGMLMGSYIKITGITDREKKQFPRLPPVAMERNSPRTVGSEEEKIPNDSFDTTFYGLPFYIQKSIGNPLPPQINILDTENMELSLVSITDLGLKSIALGTATTRVRHLTLSDGKRKPSNLWIRENPGSFPYIIRHTGENEDGPFEIILKTQKNPEGGRT